MTSKRAAIVLTLVTLVMLGVVGIHRVMTAERMTIVLVGGTRHAPISLGQNPDYFVQKWDRPARRARTNDAFICEWDLGAMRARVTFVEGVAVRIAYAMPVAAWSSDQIAAALWAGDSEWRELSYDPNESRSQSLMRKLGLDQLIGGEKVHSRRFVSTQGHEAVFTDGEMTVCSGDPKGTALLGKTSQLLTSIF